MVEQFCTEQFALRGTTPRRQRQVKNVLLELEVFLGGDLLEVTPQSFKAWFVHLLEVRKLHPNTVQYMRSAALGFYTWCAEEGKLDDATMLRLRAAKRPNGAVQGLPRPYEPQELRRFWKELDKARPRADAFVERWLAGRSRWRRVWHHAERLQLMNIVGLALYGGLRRQEIHALSLDDMDPNNEFVIVTSAKRHASVNEVRRVPYTDALRRLSEEWLEFRAHLNPDHDHPWLTLSHYDTYRANPLRFPKLEMLLVGTVGPGWELHRFRHTCATEWLRVGMPIEQLQMILGHASVQQTLAYTKIVPTDALDSMRRLQSRFDGRIARPEEAVLGGS